MVRALSSPHPYWRAGLSFVEESSDGAKGMTEQEAEDRAQADCLKLCDQINEEMKEGNWDQAFILVA